MTDISKLLRQREMLKASLSDNYEVVVIEPSAMEKPTFEDIGINPYTGLPEEYSITPVYPAYSAVPAISEKEKISRRTKLKCAAVGFEAAAKICRILAGDI